MSTAKRIIELDLEKVYSKIDIKIKQDKALTEKEIEVYERFHRQIVEQESYTYDVCIPSMYERV